MYVRNEKKSIKSVTDFSSFNTLSIPLIILKTYFYKF